jgi:enoyl-CoA hydratase/carnithine racemase
MIVTKFECITYERDSKGIAIVTLDRPEQRNTMNAEVISELCAAFDLADNDPQVRAIVLTGAGDTFCAGADLTSGHEILVPVDIQDDNGLSNRDLGGVLVLRIFRLLKPIIVAINGASAGLGATLTLPCDVRIASKTAKFGFVFTRRGIVTDGCASWFLPRIVGISTSLQWCLSGRLISADEARSNGLVSALHEPEDLLSEAMKIAEEFTVNTSAVAVSLSRRLLWQGLVENHPLESHRLETRLLEAIASSEDVNEGVASFLEKRKATFTGHVPDDLPECWPLWDEPIY